MKYASAGGSDCSRWAGKTGLKDISHSWDGLGRMLVMGIDFLRVSKFKVHRLNL